MHQVAVFAYALAAGLTFCGLAGAVMELAAGRRLCFGPPFVAMGRFGRSFALMLAAGPFMLVNEAVAACRARRIDRLALGLCAAAAAIWATATGIVVVEVALLGAALLG